MDAVQTLQIVTNTANPVPAGAGPLASGQGSTAASNLFRAMFEEAATSAAPRGGPSPFPADSMQPARERSLSALLITGAASPANPLMAGRDEAGEPGVREAETAAPPVTDGASAHRQVRKERSPETRPQVTGMGDGRKGGAKGVPMGIMPEQALLENWQPREKMDESFMGNPSERGGEPAASPEKEPVSLLEVATIGLSDTTATVMVTAEGAGMNVPAAGHRAFATVPQEVSNNPQAVAHAGAGDTLIRMNTSTGDAFSSVSNGTSATIRETEAYRPERNPQPAEFSGMEESLIPAKTATEIPGLVPRPAKLEIVTQAVPPAIGVESFHGEPHPVDAGKKNIANESAIKNTRAFPAQDSDGLAGKNLGSLSEPPGFPEIDETGPRGKENNRSITKKAAGNDLENLFQRHNQELKAEVKGETVLRQLPGGVTVLNPAQTTGMGGVSFRDEGASAAALLEPKGRASSRTMEEQGLEPPGAEAAGVLDGKREAFSQWDGAERHDNPEAGKGTQPFPGNSVSFGDPEAQVRGVEETQFPQATESDRGRVHEEILSQVREKLANHNPVSGDSRITLKLNPGELGELQLNVRMEDRKMSVEVTAQNPVVKEALLQNLDQLKDTLSRQHIHMERFDVSTGTGQQGAGQSFREGRQTAHRQFDDLPFSPAGYFREDQVAASVAGWEPREHSLVDMRL
ncbi:MAG: flagellar hook-length control protein FliK [Deltaproteobacteria bacterium]|nr:flagellar hook-length control protein FliK [Deltaproteobacteria bacterium]